MATVKLSSILYDSPFGEDCDYVKIDSLKGEPIEICEVKPILTKSGQAVYLRFDGGRRYTITFAKSIVDVMSRPKVLDTISAGDVIACTVVERPSQDDPTRSVLKLV